MAHVGISLISCEADTNIIAGPFITTTNLLLTSVALGSIRNVVATLLSETNCYQKDRNTVKRVDGRNAVLCILNVVMVHAFTMIY